MRYIKEFYRFLKHLNTNRNLLLLLSKEDLKSKYMGSILGVFWAILRPALFIFVIWFIFGIGFKSKPVEDDTPFILWLLCGFIPWFFFSDALTKSLTAITGNKYLVKKVAFRVSILPISRILSAFYVHIVFIGILIFIFLLYGRTITIYWLQLPLLMLLNFILVIGVGWLISSIRVFFKDLQEIIGVIIQFGFWVTPIFWSFKMIPEQYHTLVMANPMFYIVEGYRDALINNTWIWEKVNLSIYFVLFSIFMLVLGAIVFKRLRPHFGDVL